MIKYELKIKNNKIIFDGHAEDPVACHTLTLLCDILQKNSKTIEYRNGYAEFELEGISSEDNFWFTDTVNFYINDIPVSIVAAQDTLERIVAGNLDIEISYNNKGVTVHNKGSLAAKVKMLSDNNNATKFFKSSLDAPTICVGETYTYEFTDEVTLVSANSEDSSVTYVENEILDEGARLTIEVKDKVDNHKNLVFNEKIKAPGKIEKDLNFYVGSVRYTRISFECSNSSDCIMYYNEDKVYDSSLTNPWLDEKYREITVDDSLLDSAPWSCNIDNLFTGVCPPQHLTSDLLFITILQQVGQMK